MAGTKEDAMTRVASVASVTSRDGTPIAYERSGDGPALILVLGAFCDRAVAAPLAAVLAPHFTTFAYDRRGRGDSGDTQPYAVEREVEDLAALMSKAGGTALVYGHSSGAVLAIEGAARGLPIRKLVLYEPPFLVDDSRSPMPEDFESRLRAFVAAGRRGDAVECFWQEALQMPPEAIASARKTPMWPGLEALAHTLLYDQAIAGPYQTGRPLPVEWARTVTMPTLVLDGGDSPDYMRNAVAAVAQLLPQAERRTLPGQGHGAPPDVLAPIISEFFAR
jgi:pimeloyl-ACP methyl ester carboxylesterase